MKYAALFFFLSVSTFLLTEHVCGQEAASTDKTAIDEAASDLSPEQEAELISDARQITFEGLRAGEGYFNGDGTRMVFQSERDPANPFYQIFLMDLETGDIEKVSPGEGKTTCAWIHPDGQRVLFSSTHHDKTSVQKQNELLELRRTGNTPRYSWDYDPEFDIYERIDGGSYNRLTDARGYDAEGSYSPDGSQIVFYSNRGSGRRQLWMMNADGSGERNISNNEWEDWDPVWTR